MMDYYFEHLIVSLQHQPGAAVSAHPGEPCVRALGTQASGTTSGSAVTVGKCTGQQNQQFELTPSGHTVDDVYTVAQGKLCVDQEKH